MITYTFDLATLISVGLGIVLPLLVALVTKRVTSGAVKGLLLGALSILGGLLTEIGSALTTGTSFDPIEWLILTLTALISGQTTYSAIWKPTGLAPALQLVGENRGPKPLEEAPTPSAEDDVRDSLGE